MGWTQARIFFKGFLVVVTYSQVWEPLLYILPYLVRSLDGSEGQKLSILASLVLCALPEGVCHSACGGVAISSLSAP